MPTFTQIGTAQVAGAGGVTAFDFTSIPATYTDLVLKFSLRTDNASNYLSAQVTFNGSTSGYSYRMVYGLGSGAPTSANGSGSYIDWSAYGTGSTATSSTFGNGEIYIPNYAGSTNKSISADSVSENNATQAIAALTAGLWSNTAAINRITLTGNSGNLMQYSTAYLYGVSNA